MIILKNNNKLKNHIKYEFFYNSNEFIFTGLQILNHSVFSSKKNKIFSMNNIWNDLIENNSLIGIGSNQKFYHLNTKEMYDKILSLNITD